MFTITSTRSNVNVPFVEHVTCLACGERYAHEIGTHDPELCEACRRGTASAEAVKLVGQVRELVEGRGAFAELPLEDRREQLRQLGLLIEPFRNAADAPDAKTREDVESRIEDERYIDTSEAEPLPYDPEWY